MQLFLDDGGVISQNAPRAAQWERLVAEFFVSRLGGSPSAWAEANRTVMRRSWREGGFGGFEEYYEQVGGLQDDAFEADLDAHFAAWLGAMCQLVGVPSPANAVRLADEACVYVTERVVAPFPEVVEAMRALASDHSLHTASGERSIELDGYLRALGVRELFAHQLFGIDLVRVPKVSAEFYRRAFEQVAALQPVVVDDSPIALGWAAEAGARTILLDRLGKHTFAGATIRSLSELPATLAR